MQVRHENRRPKLRVLSAPEKREPQFAIEPFYVIAKELPPLFRRHWREFGRDRDYVPLDPNWDDLMAMSIAGRLRILTARDGETLVGYIFNIVGPHLHYRSTVHSVVDMYYLEPRYRGGWTWVKMLRRNDEEMKKMGVVRAFISENLMAKGKRGRMFRIILRRLGYRPIDVHYKKVF